MSLLKPVLLKVKDVFGRRVLRYTATIGSVVGEAKTPKAAAEIAEQLVLWALKRLEEGTKVITQHGRVGVIFPNTHGWGYLIVDTECSAAQAAVVVFSERDNAETQCRSHMAQMAWTADVEDDEEFMDVGFFDGKVRNRFRSGLETWIRFQRAFIDLKAQHPEWSSERVHAETLHHKGELRRRAA